MTEQCSRKLDESACIFAENAARVAADRAVHQTFAVILGVDINSPEKVADFQAALRFGNKVMMVAEKSVMVGIITIVGMSVTGIAMLIKERLLR